MNSENLASCWVFGTFSDAYAFVSILIIVQFLKNVYLYLNYCYLTCKSFERECEKERIHLMKTNFCVEILKLTFNPLFTYAVFWFFQRLL